MTTILNNTYLVIQGTHPGTDSPVFWGNDTGFCYNGPFEEIGYLLGVPSHTESLKRDFKAVKEEYPEYNPFIAKVDVVFKTTKYRQKNR